MDIQPRFYMLMGFPGSGKSMFADELINTHTTDSERMSTSKNVYKYICHDQILTENYNNMGKSKARKKTHQDILYTLSTLMENLVIYDSVNSNSEGRSVFINCVPKNYAIYLVYFKPSPLINNGMYETYVKLLHSNRQSHHLFPKDEDRAIETLINIKKGFEEPTENEKIHYTLIVKESFFK